MKSLRKVMILAIPVADCLAIVIIWCIVALAGCSASRHQEPSTVNEFLQQPRIAP